MDWKSLFSQAFPQKQPFKKYEWPKLEKPGPGDASSYPALKKPGPGPGSSYPELAAPSASPSSGPWPELKKDTAYPSSSFPELKKDSKLPPNQMPNPRMTDHYGDFGFRVEIEGMDVGGFQKVEGLTTSIETIEYQHSDDLTPRKRMGRVKVENVRLVKGYVNTDILYKWCEDAMKGDISRKSISLVLLADDHGTELTRYNLFECWPCKWSSFRVDGKGQGALVEEIELVVEQVERA